MRRTLPSTMKRTSQFARDLLHVDRHAAIAERGRARTHRQHAPARQLGDDVLGDAVAEIRLLRIAAQVGERQDGDGWLCPAWAPARRRPAAARTRRRRRAARRDRGSRVLHRALLRATRRMLRRQGRRRPGRPAPARRCSSASARPSSSKPVSSLLRTCVVRAAGDVDAAGLGDAFQARGDVDAVAIQSSPSTITSPRLMPMRSTMRRSSRQAGVGRGHPLLQLHRRIPPR